MPLGFAKSTFTYAAAATGSGARAFFGGTRDNSGSPGDVATYRVAMKNARFSNNTGISFVYWIRYKFSELSSNNQHRVLTYRDYQDLGGGQTWVGNGTNPFAIGANIYNGNQNIVMSIGKSGSTYGNNLTAAQGVGDGSWHCVMMRLDMADASKRSIYIDGEDHTAGQTAGASVSSTTSGNNPKLDEIDFIGIKAAPGTDKDDTRTGGDVDGGGYTSNSSQQFPSADLGPVWFYDTDVDFTSSSVRAKYYNASNTDGYVDGGTDGTDGGAGQPELYLYHNASTLLNGGSLSTRAPFVVANGSGAISIVADTDGPGSGGTR